MFELNKQDTLVYELGDFPDSIVSIQYGKIESIFGSFGFQEQYMKTEYRIEVINRELVGIARKSSCLNGQLICEEPCQSPEDNYVVKYCNGKTRTLADSCWCWGNQCGPLGYTRWFYHDGTIEREGEVTNLLPDGKRKPQYHEIGKWKYYDLQGKLIKTITWNPEGVIVKETLLQN